MGKTERSLSPEGIFSAVVKEEGLKLEFGSVGLHPERQ